MLELKHVIIKLQRALVNLSIHLMFPGANSPERLCRRAIKLDIFVSGGRVTLITVQNVAKCSLTT